MFFFFLQRQVRWNDLFTETAVTISVTVILYLLSGYTTNSSFLEKITSGFWENLFFTPLLNSWFFSFDLMLLLFFFFTPNALNCPVWTACSSLHFFTFLFALAVSLFLCLSTLLSRPADLFSQTSKVTPVCLSFRFSVPVVLNMSKARTKCTPVRLMDWAN